MWVVICHRFVPVKSHIWVLTCTVALNTLYWCYSNNKWIVSSAYIYLSSWWLFPFPFCSFAWLRIYIRVDNWIFLVKNIENDVASMKCTWDCILPFATAMRNELSLSHAVKMFLLYSWQQLLPLSTLASVGSRNFIQLVKE